MAHIVTVFLSSVGAGLEEYRNGVYRAIEGMDRHHCVRMEDFGARDALSVHICEEKVAECDMFVGIAGHLYGSCPAGSEKSFSEIEYDAAVDAAKPRFMFLAPEEAPVPANLIETPEKLEKQRAFRAKVLSERQAFIYDPDPTGGLDLPTRVVQAIHNARQDIARFEEDTRAEKLTTLLLFPFVTNQSGFDTGIVITNASAPPFGTGEPTSGTCILQFFGPKALPVQATSVVMPGEQLLFTLSGGNPTQLVPESADFQGYLVAECRFPDAHGYAFITNGFGGIPTIASSYVAKVIPERRCQDASPSAISHLRAGQN